MTQSPIGSSRLISSAAGMKSSGKTSPRSGSFQRSSASIDGEPPGLELHDRLVVQDELVLGDRAPQPRRQRQPLERVLGDVGVDGRGRAAAALALVHRHVGVLEQLDRRRARPRGRARCRCSAWTWNSAPETLNGSASRAATSSAACARRRLAVVASSSGSRIRNSSPPRRASMPVALDPAQAPGDPPQQPVAGAVAEGVVDELEVVEVDEQQRDRAAGARAARSRSGAAPPRAAPGWAGRSAGRSRRGGRSPPPRAGAR